MSYYLIGPLDVFNIDDLSSVVFSLDLFSPAFSWWSDCLCRAVSAYAKSAMGVLSGFCSVACDSHYGYRGPLLAAVYYQRRWVVVIIC